MKIEPPFGLTHFEFEMIYDQLPIQKRQEKIDGMLVERPICTKVLSKLDQEQEVPDRLRRFITEHRSKHAQTLNRIVLNYYESGGFLSKQTSACLKQYKPNSNVYSFFFGPAVRNFILEPILKKGKFYEQHLIKVEHNTLILMGGKCQMTHFHSVPKSFNTNFQESQQLNVVFETHF